MLGLPRGRTLAAMTPWMTQLATDPANQHSTGRWSLLLPVPWPLFQAIEDAHQKRIDGTDKARLPSAVPTLFFRLAGRVTSGDACHDWQMAGVCRKAELIHELLHSRLKRELTHVATEGAQRLPASIVPAHGSNAGSKGWQEGSSAEALSSSRSCSNGATLHPSREAWCVEAPNP